MSSATPTRSQPLAAPTPNGQGADGVAHVVPSRDAQAEVDRQRRFREGLQALRVGGGTLKLGERVLMVAGGILGPLGLLVVLLGWWGASQTPYVFEQVPYLISGGLLGLGLVFLGAFLYFAHWLTELVKEHRAQSAAIVDALGRLQEEVTQLRDRPAGGAPLVATAPAAPGAAPRAVLVATAHGTMSHTPDCVVVAGKPGLRDVTEDEGLQPCKLCQA